MDIWYTFLEEEKIEKLLKDLKTILLDPFCKL